MFQRHRHLRHRFRRGVPDGGGGGPVPVRVHVHEERAGSTRRRLQHLLHQHCEPGLPRWVKDQGARLPFNNTGLRKEMKIPLIDVHKYIRIHGVAETGLCKHVGTTNLTLPVCSASVGPILFS